MDCIGARAMALGIGDVNLVAIHQNAGRKPSHRQMRDDLHLFCVDDADGVRSGFGDQQPSGRLVKREPDGQHAAQILQAGDSDRNVRDRLVRLCIDHRNGIVRSVRHKHAIRRRHHAGGTTATIAALSERQACADKGLHTRSGRIFQIDDGQRVRFVHVGVAEAGDVDFAFSNLALGALHGFRRGKSERRERQTGLARLLLVRSGYRLVFEHPDVGDVGAPPVGRKRRREGQPAQP